GSQHRISRYRVHVIASTKVGVCVGWMLADPPQKSGWPRRSGILSGHGRSDVLTDADGVAYFHTDLSLYHQREGWEPTQCLPGLSASFLHRKGNLSGSVIKTWL
ncbi:MAG: hypothetical protein V3U43_05555, partial [Pseudomonadales bacterium]